MLPVADYDCYSQLPWMAYQPHLRKEDVAKANEAIANLYSPTLAPGFSLMLGPDDWINREAVCRVALLSRPGKNPIEQLSLDELVI